MTSPLNILHVIADQHQAACLGAEGHPLVITPHLDRLAAEGVRFRHAYTQIPICTPSRVSIFSGQYPHNHGYFGLSGPTPRHLPNFLRHFRQHGYCTAAIGQVDVPDDPVDWLHDDCDVLLDAYRGPVHGEFGTSPYFHYLERLGLRDNEDWTGLPEFPGRQQHEARPSLLPFEHSPEGWCVQEAIRFMDGGDGQPFCMQVALPRPHQCYTPDRRFWEMYPADLPLPETLYHDAAHRPPHFRRMVERLRQMEWLIEPKTFEDGCRRVWRGYLACITHVDHALGLLLDYLDRTGRAGNTIVIYGADHGAYSGAFGVPEKAPGICSELVCRVPFLWRVPGVTPGGHVATALVENVDIAPTLAALCGLPPMRWADGCDLSGLLRGDGSPVRAVAVTENVWSKAVRWGPWRFVHYPPQMFGGQDVGELYHLDDDPHETRNLYHDAAHQAVVQEGRRHLLDWLIRTTRPVTVWPAPQWPPITYDLAEDGKEANGAGPAARARAGELNYL